MISFQGIEVAQGAKEIPFVGAFDVASDTGALMPRIVVQLSNMEVLLGIMVDELKRDKTINMDISMRTENDSSLWPFQKD